jgi:hypothetical protein
VVVVGNAPHAVGVPAHCAWQEPPPAHLVRALCGWPLVSVVQVPTLPETSQASHCPPHRRLQQTPSTQWPLPHSLSLAHFAAFGLAHVPVASALQTRPVPHALVVQHAPSTQLPVAHWSAAVQTAPAGFFATHAPALQYVPATQAVASLAVEHVDAQTPPAPHWKSFGQVPDDCATHAPSALQYSVGVKVEPVHCDARQDVAVLGNAPHAPALVPSHCAWQSPVPAQSARTAGASCG